MLDLQTWTMVWVLPEGRGLGGEELRGKTWDNCNSINNKIKKNKNWFQKLENIYITMDSSFSTGWINSSHPFLFVFPLQHRWQTQGLQAESSPPACFIQPAPCFHQVATLSSGLTVKGSYIYSPKITFGHLKATSKLMWPQVKMSLTPLLYREIQTLVWK